MAIETLQTHVVHCSRAKYDVYIGRPGKWGNPYRIGMDGTREEVIQKYVEYLMQRRDLIDALPELKDKILGCWCAPKFCHGHVLVALVADVHECSWCGEIHYGGPEYCQA